MDATRAPAPGFVAPVSPDTLPLTASLDLHRSSSWHPYVLRRDRVPLYVNGFPLLEADDSPELRAFAADIAALCQGDHFLPIDADTPRDGTDILGFGRRPDTGELWWMVIRWDGWKGPPARWVSAETDQPTPGEPLLYQVLRFPRAVLTARALGEGGAGRPAQPEQPA